MKFKNEHTVEYMKTMALKEDDGYFELSINQRRVFVSCQAFRSDSRVSYSYTKNDRPVDETFVSDTLDNWRNGISRW